MDHGGEKVSLGWFLYLLLDNVGTFFGHETDVAEGLDDHHCVHLVVMVMWQNNSQK